MCSGYSILKRKRLSQNKIKVERRRKKQKKNLLRTWIISATAGCSTDTWTGCIVWAISPPKLSVNLIVTWRITALTSRSKPVRSCRQKSFRSPVQHQLQLLFSISSRLRKRLKAPLSCQLQTEKQLLQRGDHILKLLSGTFKIMVMSF